jgi:hypothetical protein
MLRKTTFEAYWLEKLLATLLLLVSHLLKNIFACESAVADVTAAVGLLWVPAVAASVPRIVCITTFYDNRFATGASICSVIAAVVGIFWSQSIDVDLMLFLLLLTSLKSLLLLDYLLLLLSLLLLTFHLILVFSKFLAPLLLLTSLLLSETLLFLAPCLLTSLLLLA